MDTKVVINLILCLIGLTCSISIFVLLMIARKQEKELRKSIDRTLQMFSDIYNKR